MGLKCEKDEDDNEEEEGEEGEDDEQQFCAWITEEEKAYEGAQAGETIKLKSAVKCQKQCEENAECVGYTFTLKSKKGKCYLKKEITGGSTDAKSISGYFECDAATEGEVIESSNDPISWEL